MRKSNMIIARLGLASLLLFSSTSYATITTLTGALSGANENPATGSPATGNTTVVYDSTAHTLNVFMRFQVLSGNATAAHIHCCIAPPGNAGVATTTPTFAGFPIGSPSVTFSTTLDMTLASSYNPAFVTANGGTTAGAEAALAAGFANGTTYLNVHSTVFPGGEIRSFLAITSFISDIPSLSRVGLGLLVALLALAGVLLVRRLS